ncbi:DUF3618 domain-containing protein [Nocardiopsis algeriensis]|nr:DUF3618 domain-containing protein [Nocardiopsis algeriensis]
MTGSDTGPRQTPAELEAEINEEQRRLAETIDRLLEEARPANIARRRLEQARDHGTRLVEEARALVIGGNAVRVESHLVEPEEGSVLLKGDEEVVSTYQSRRRLPPEVIALAVGLGMAVTVGVVAWAVRRRRS